MAALTVQTITAAGIVPAAPTQISAWGTPDTISSGDIGDRGVIAEIINGTAGSLDFRVEDPGTTPAGNAAANGYTTHTVAAGAARRVFIGRHNVDLVAGTVSVGASASDAAFTIRLFRY